jgi:hypothetical protein
MNEDYPQQVQEILDLTHLFSEGDFPSLIKLFMNKVEDFNRLSREELLELQAELVDGIKIIRELPKSDLNNIEPLILKGYNAICSKYNIELFDNETIRIFSDKEEMKKIKLISNIIRETAKRNGYYEEGVDYIQKLVESGDWG